MCGVCVKITIQEQETWKLGHTIVKMKCAASRAMEIPDDVRLRAQSSARGVWEIRQEEKRRHETGNCCGQHARGDVTCETLRRL